MMNHWHLAQLPIGDGIHWQDEIFLHFFKIEIFARRLDAPLKWMTACEPQKGLDIVVLLRESHVWYKLPYVS